MSKHTQHNREADDAALDALGQGQIELASLLCEAQQDLKAAVRDCHDKSPTAKLGRVMAYLIEQEPRNRDAEKVIYRAWGRAVVEGRRLA